MADTKRNETNSTPWGPGDAFTVEDATVDVRRLRPHPDNTYEMDPDELQALTENIEQIGLIQPPFVREVEDGGLQILSGHRRCMALKKLAKKDLKWAEVPVRIAHGMSDADALFVLHGSNINRQMKRADRVRQTELLEERVKELRAEHPDWKGLGTARIIANMLGMSERSYYQKTKIAKSLVDGLYGYYDEGLLTAHVAERLARRPDSYQYAVVEMLDAKRPKTTKEARLIVEDMETSVPERLDEFHSLVVQADEALFRARDAMRRDGRRTHVDVSRVEELRAKFEEMLREANAPL